MNRGLALQGLGDTSNIAHRPAGYAGRAERCTSLFAGVRALSPVINLKVSSWIELVMDVIAPIVLLRADNPANSESRHRRRYPKTGKIRDIPPPKQHQAARLRARVSVWRDVVMLQECCVSYDGCWGNCHINQNVAYNNIVWRRNNNADCMYIRSNVNLMYIY